MGIIQLHLCIDQLVSEFLIPGLQCFARIVVRQGAIWSHNQQRVRFAVGRRVALPSPMLARRTKRRIERVSRAKRTFEITPTKDNAFRLNGDSIFAAFDVDRPALRSVHAVIGNNRERLEPR